MTGCFSRPDNNAIAVFTSILDWNPLTSVVPFKLVTTSAVPFQTIPSGFRSPRGNATAVSNNRDRVPTSSSMRATVCLVARMRMVRPANVFSHHGWHSRGDEAGSATTESDQAAFSRQFPALPLSHPTLRSEHFPVPGWRTASRSRSRGSHRSPLPFRGGNPRKFPI